ncbi:MAG: DNA-processing protein DprA [Clostridia bacterium]|nr:DNA-processing protein DprA [Clostridia bacterium]
MDIYSLWLTSRLGAATVKTSALLECYGTAEALYHASPWEAAAKVGLGRAEAERLAQRDLSDIYRLADRLGSLGIGTLHPADPAYPPLLREIRTAPFTLFYKGDPHALDDRVVVAVVGTRSCTRYGAAVAEKLAGEMAGCGVVIVSGMADGIDTCANLGALKAQGKTVAVLGSGIDRPYPSHNGYLMEQIIESGGLVLSEYPPGSPIQRGNFPARNRIISGISHGVVVVEAPKKSGALITARLALEQNRDLFTVPGNITSYPSEGTNQLLKDSCAKPVTETLDILEEYLDRLGASLQALQARRDREQSLPDKPQEPSRPAPPARPAAPPPARPAAPPPSAPPSAAPSREQMQRELNLSADEAALLALIGPSPMSADALIKESGIPVGKTMAALTMLEAKGYLRSLPGARFEKAFPG